MMGAEPAAQDHLGAELIARVNRLELRVDDLDQLFPVPDGPPAPGDASKNEGAFGDWVASFFTELFIRPLGGERRWCRQWQEHPEAVFRLTALHRAQAVLRTDSEMGDALWLRDHLDPQLSVLLSARGPFAMCSRDRHEGPVPVSL